MALTQMTFKLPPQGLLVRDFVVAAISTLLDLPIARSIKNEGDKILVEVPLGNEGDILHAIFQGSYSSTKNKLNLMFSPKLGRNDVNAIVKFHEETKQTINKDISLLEFALQVLEWAQKECHNSTNKFLMSYGFIQEKPSNLILGGDRYAALQLFKVEKYEYGRDFLRDYEAVKMQIKHDIYWLALLMAGLSLTYSGIINNELVFITVPEDFAFYEKEFKAPTYLFFSLPRRIVHDKDKGVSIIVHRISRLDPIFAFLQLLSYALVREWYKDFDFELLSQAPIQIYRVRMGQTYTLVEKNISDLAPFTRFAYKLFARGGESGDSALRKIEGLLRNYYGLDHSNHHSVSMKLYQAVSGSYNTYSIVYELGRLLAPATSKRVFNEEEEKAIINALIT